MSVPRKFSEKIAIQKQKAAEQEEAFASIMREVNSARNPQTLSPHDNRIGLNGMPSSMLYKGGSLPAFPTPRQEVQIAPREVVNDLSSTYSGRSLYDDQSFRSRSHHHGRVLHRPKARADTSPYYLPQYQTLRDNGMWRRTYSDPSIGPMQRGSPSPKISPKEPKSPQSNVKPSDGAQGYGSSVMHDRTVHHMKVLNNTGSLPDVANLCIDIPMSTASDIDDNLKQQRQLNNHMKFTVPSAVPIRRNLNTSKQVFPRQFSNPESKEMMSKEQQRFLINQLSQELQGSTLHSPTSPGSTVPQFGSMSPLAYEGMYPPGFLPSNAFDQEQYMNLLRMNEQPMKSQQPPRYEESLHQQQVNAVMQQAASAAAQNKVANMRNEMHTANQPDSAVGNNEFANQFRMGVTGSEEQKDDISDDILNNIRIGLDPLNFEDYQLLANSDFQVADQSAEEQFRQDRINFP
eukprot:gene10092-11123_t